MALLLLLLSMPLLHADLDSLGAPGHLLPDLLLVDPTASFRGEREDGDHRVHSSLEELVDR
eukprot:2829885-Pyramimonas_sp.AAC.1